MERELQIISKGKLSIVPEIILLSFYTAPHEWEY
jgi:hypothetical protein